MHVIIIKWWIIEPSKTIHFYAISLEINHWNVHCFTHVRQRFSDLECINQNRFLMTKQTCAKLNPDIQKLRKYLLTGMPYESRNDIAFYCLILVITFPGITCHIYNFYTMCFNLFLAPDTMWDLPNPSLSGRCPVSGGPTDWCGGHSDSPRSCLYLCACVFHLDTVPCLQVMELINAVPFTNMFAVEADNRPISQILP